MNLSMKNICGYPVTCQFKFLRKDRESWIRGEFNKNIDNCYYYNNGLLNAF